MKWGDWKKWMEERGVKDEDEIAYIDCSEPRDVELKPAPSYKPADTPPRWAVW